MKKIVPLLVLSLAFAPAAVFASKSEGPKARALSKFDTDKDGQFNAAEIAVIRDTYAEDPQGDLKRFDTDKDGKLSDAEIAQMIPGSGKKGGGKKSDAGDDAKKAGKKGGEKAADGEKKAGKKKSGS